MRAHDKMRRSAVLLVALAALQACVERTGEPQGEVVVSENDAGVAGPPIEELFVEKQEICDAVTLLDQPCTFLYFDDAVLQRWCVVPDADSFDDFRQLGMNADGSARIDPMTNRPVVIIPRGVTPFPGACEADGHATGPGRDTYYPSHFCPVPHCVPNH